MRAVSYGMLSLFGARRYRDDALNIMTLKRLRRDQQLNSF